MRQPDERLDAEQVGLHHRLLRQQGRITPEGLLEVLAAQQRTFQTLLEKLRAAEQRCAELEQKLRGAPSAKLVQPFSMRAAAHAAFVDRRAKRS